MVIEQQAIFKELNPYGGEIDRNNRWIKLSEQVPWDNLEVIYLRYFNPKKHLVIKKSRLILGLMVGQMLMGQSDRTIIEYFHENPYFQYFCGQNSFVIKREKGIIHHSLLSKRRKRLGAEYMHHFEQEVIRELSQKGLIKGDQLILDATVFPADISYPNDVKLLNSVREYLCQTILDVKNTYDPKGRIRTVRKTARKLFLSYQKTKRKSQNFIRKTRKKMIRYVTRNIAQLETVLEKAKTLKDWQTQQIQEKLSVAKTILAQQIHMAQTKGRKVANRIVSFHRPDIRPIIRGKEGNRVEFGPKAHVALVDGFAILDHVQYENFNEGIQVQDCVDKHRSRFGKHPTMLLADQLYANRHNRDLLKEKGIPHSFKRIGRPPNESPTQSRFYRRNFKKKQGQRNHIEATFGHLKSRFNLNVIKWSVPDAHSIQIRLGLIAFNLNSAISKA